MLNRTIVFEIALLLLAFSVCGAQELSARRTAQALTNQDVIEMVGLGSDGLMIDKVRAAQLTDFDTTVAGLRVTSPVRLSNPLELMVRAPDGTSVTEYQLLRLYEKGNRREFRAMTGGILHVCGGAERTGSRRQSSASGSLKSLLARRRLSTAESSPIGQSVSRRFRYRSNCAC